MKHTPVLSTGFEPWDEITFSLLLNRLRSNPKTMTHRQREFFSWYKGLKEPMERKVVIFLACQVYNAVHERLSGKFYVLDALEVACELLLHKGECKYGV